MGGLTRKKKQNKTKQNKKLHFIEVYLHVLKLCRQISYNIKLQLSYTWSRKDRLFTLVFAGKASTSKESSIESTGKSSSVFLTTGKSFCIVIGLLAVRYFLTQSASQFSRYYVRMAMIKKFLT